MLIVKKYGGSSVATPERVRNVARQIIEDVEAGHRIVVVLSAQGKTTDQLLARAREMNPNPSRRELDMLISTGEQQSVALMAITLQSMGYQAVSLNAFQVPMYTNKVYGSARLERIGTERLEAELDCGNVVLVTGFQGINRYEDVTTLGRGGSDTTAVALAAALHADRCQIYTDVEGVYTADPRYVKNARKLAEIGYDEMLELASTGAKVLHNRCVEMAKKYNVEIEVLSSMVKATGTIVKEDSLLERMMVSGVAADKNVARISVMRIPDRPGKAFSLFNLLSQNDINVDIILQSIGHDGTKDISFTVAEDSADEAVAILQEHLGQLEAAEVTCFKDVAKVSLVGAGMVSNSGIATQMFEALYDAHVNIRMISTSEIKISVLIDEDQVEEAVVAIHDQFRLYEKK